MNDNLLKFGEPNSKLKKLAKKLKLKLKTFSLPSGWTCPGAKECHSRADRETGKIKDGKHTEFRCFQASAEAVYPSLRKAVWHNMDLLDGVLKDINKKQKWKALADLICESLPKADIYRVHVGGDYFNYDYLIAWCEVARRHPERIFYSYTKSLHLWTLFPSCTDGTRAGIPSNLILTASRGGHYDSKIEENAFKCAEVVFSEQEAIDKGLEIDHDDEHAAFGKSSFALLLHGVQPKGSKASKALSAIKKSNKQLTRATT
jgi:hypothetical protein